MSTVDERVLATDDPPPPDDRGPGPGGALLAVGRRGWRWLTSMRTALILLFLLAVAAIPGSLLPQRNLNVTKVQQYYVDHPKLAPFLDRIGAFNVFASPWFSAIYLLLFVSLVGCLVPRFRAHITAMVKAPPRAPKRLDRLPVNAPLRTPAAWRSTGTARRSRRGCGICCGASVSGSGCGSTRTGRARSPRKRDT
jgi:cytochrome c biogenesis protein